MLAAGAPGRLLSLRVHLAGRLARLTDSSCPPGLLEAEGAPGGREAPTCPPLFSPPPPSRGEGEGEEEKAGKGGDAMPTLAADARGNRAGELLPSPWASVLSRPTKMREEER